MPSMSQRYVRSAAIVIALGTFLSPRVLRGIRYDSPLGVSNRIIIHIGDITDLRVDAVVNAANEHLLGGGGVDGAVHAKAGPQLKLKCAQFNEVVPGVRCRPGEAKLTRGYRLSARYIIHTVGPRWKGGDMNEENVLRQAYTTALEIASEKRMKTVAFPCVSTGIFWLSP